ncbi:MAG: NUDIX hydrolase [Microgenomates group bacterium GW2011_GWF2_45_18]|nr:MAG: NUDIX hydrolase [Microgenomates group bacterium GW2011_GWF1_44_10]KKU01603.1 MAG: NUDIX hydrolase [Microgenomates group bacterium GW2011_GWF2_45_18]OGJ41557.1 MAG: hypothetical protein A2378_01455 [Candidatus Pacebacteria bacterium RIFOXYB1_FULL_44_10]
MYVVTQQKKQRKKKMEDWQKYPIGKIPKGEPCPHCARYNGRACTVEMVVFRESDHAVLLIYRLLDPDKNTWALPGGYLDWEETVMEGAIREAREETGVSPTRVQFLGVYDDLNRDPDGRQNVGHAFIGWSSEQPTQDNTETGGAKWIPFAELPEKIPFDHAQIIRDAYAFIDPNSSQYQKPTYCSKGTHAR